MSMLSNKNHFHKIIFKGKSSKVNYRMELGKKKLLMGCNHTNMYH